MKRILLMIVCFAAITANALAQNGEIYGTVVDETAAPFGGVAVKITQGGMLKGAAATEDDGSYSVKSLKPGIYDVSFFSQGYRKQEIRSVKVTAGSRVKVNMKLQIMDSMVLKEVTIGARYKAPLVSKTEVVTARSIERAPTRDITDLNSLQSNVYQNGRGSGLRIGGARSDGTVYMIDGQGNGSSRRQRRREAGRTAAAIAPQAASNTESYRKEKENDFMNVKSSPLSTMSVDVDHASYANVRRFINSGAMPPPEAVRVEELINYFDYNYPQPIGDDPIAITTELGECPWNKEHMLLKIGMQARKTATDKLPPSNIVFLVDVSGSMNEDDKLPLLKSAFKLLTSQLRKEDKVSIVVYAGSAGIVLPATSGADKATIENALDQLQAGGSTAGGQGIQLAYKVAADNFIKGGNNRVVLATDGDFNVGLSSDYELEQLIGKEKEKGIFLSCLGFGTGNFKDSKMEALADKGNGNYNYIDNLEEGRKTLVKEFGGTIFTVAKDVKTQIEFNPNWVNSYRLVGYENRLLNTEDFKDDKKDAGDMGSGHSVTILYELVPSGKLSKANRKVNELKYQETVRNTDPELDRELATIKFRYKQPDGHKSRELEHVVGTSAKTVATISPDTRFAAAVAMFGMLLTSSQYNKEGNYAHVLELAEAGNNTAEGSYRAEFIDLVKKARDRSSTTGSR